jgi:hypothetical protein
MKRSVLYKIYLAIAIIAIILFALTFVHPGPFIGFYRIPDPRTMLEATLGIICLMAIVPVAKSYLGKGTKSAFIVALVSIVLYFILRFIHIPGKVLWLFLVLALVCIAWSAISVIANRGK